MKRFLKTSLWVLVALLFIGTFVYLYIKSGTQPETFEVVQPATLTIEKNTVLTGTIEPRDEIAIKPKISGIIAEINVEAGDMVNSGDIIARIKVVPDETQLASAKNRINTAEISLSDANTRHQRNTTLYERKVISLEEYQQTLTEVEKAKEELSAAKKAYSIVKEGISPDNATESNTLVRATTSGLVLDVPVKVGGSVIQSNNFNDGTTIATIADMNKRIFKGTVDETEVGNLHPGQEMAISVGALPDIELKAIIEFISPKSTSTSGANTFELKAGLTVPEGIMLRAGYSANAKVLLSKAENVMTVPEAVIEYEGTNAFVYVQKDKKDTVQPLPLNKFERKPITTGLSDGINVEVRDGVSADDRLRGASTTKVVGGAPHP